MQRWNLSLFFIQTFDIGESIIIGIGQKYPIGASLVLISLGERQHRLYVQHLLYNVLTFLFVLSC